jgi:hypothetical protein
MRAKLHRHRMQRTTPMRLARRATIGLAALLAACTPMPPTEIVTLPASAMPQGLGDPTRGAILSAAYGFGAPASLAGDPAGAAMVLGHLEYLAVELATGRWQDLDAFVVPELRAGRAEARAAFGFSQGAPAQLAVDSLYGAAAALRANDRATATAAISRLVQPGGEAAALQRLAAMPFLPRAAGATRRAEQALTRRDQQSNQDWVSLRRR